MICAFGVVYPTASDAASALLTMPIAMKLGSDVGDSDWADSGEIREIEGSDPPSFTWTELWVYNQMSTFKLRWTFAHADTDGRDPMEWPWGTVPCEVVPDGDSVWESDEIYFAVRHDHELRAFVGPFDSIDEATEHSREIWGQQSPEYRQRCSEDPEQCGIAVVRIDEHMEEHTVRTEGASA